MKAADFWQTPKLLKEHVDFVKILNAKEAPKDGKADTKDAKADTKDAKADTKDAKANTSNILLNALTRWLAAFPNSSEAKGFGKVVAPLLPAMGADTAIAMFNTLVPKKVVSRLPSYTSVSDNCVCFGAMKDSIHFGPEPHFLGPRHGNSDPHSLRNAPVVSKLHLPFVIFGVRSSCAPTPFLLPLAGWRGWYGKGDRKRDGGRG